jgi:hypothetical protein
MVEMDQADFDLRPIQNRHNACHVGLLMWPPQIAHDDIESS